MTADYLCTTCIGMERIAANEVKRITGVKVGIHRGAVSFTGTEEQAARVVYCAQSIAGFLRIIWKGTLGTVDKIPGDEAAKWVGGESTFMVACDKDNPDVASMDITKIITEQIVKHTSAKHTYKNFTVSFLLYSRDEVAWFGVDLAGIDLGRRAYRVFLGTKSLKGNIAYGLLAMAGFTGTETLLDPFCRHGIIPIEAALLAIGRSSHFFTKHQLALGTITGYVAEYQNVVALVDAAKTESKAIVYCADNNPALVQAAKKNATIAGVADIIEFTRKSTDWLDISFPEGSIQCVVTYPPQPSHSFSSDKHARIIREFFRRIEPVLHAQGRIALIVQGGKDVVLKVAMDFGFSSVDEAIFWQGAEQLPVMVFAKKEVDSKKIL